MQINPASLCEVSASEPKRTVEFKNMQMTKMVQVHITSYKANMKKMNAIKNVVMAYQHALFTGSQEGRRGSVEKIECDRCYKDKYNAKCKFDHC